LEDSLASWADANDECVVRGLHCQIGDNTQGKLVRVLNGAIWDVAIDIRRSSPTYGQHVAAILSAENGAQLWVPHGFLHGFCALEPDTDVLYKVDAPYDRAAERGVRWNDPGLALPWPLAPGEAIVSDKDMELPTLSACDAWFE
jgi:dTDP-4-dehydrorhamnose 3,5-epimerase